MSESRLEQLLNMFDAFLRDQRGLTGIQGARRAREVRRQALYRLYHETRAEHNEARLRDEAERRMMLADGETRGVWEDVIVFLDAILPAVQPVQVGVQQEPARPPEVVGRIAPTERTPSGATSFPFWVRQGELVALGDLLAADGNEGRRRVTVVGVVHDLRAYAAYRDLSDHFMACDMGVPEAEAPTQVPFILAGEAGVLWRSDGQATPPGGDWALRRATAREIRLALSGGIPPEYAVPAGFVSAPGGELVPVDMDARWLIGYEGGHVNVAGVSGVAAKTSYGLFLLHGIMSLNQRSEAVRREGGVAVIAFNVKELDLLHLDNVAGWADAPREVAQHVQMWELLASNYSMDPEIMAQNVRYFAPGTGGEARTLRRQGAVDTFSYGWVDLRRSPQAFMALFDPDDLDERMLGAIDGLIATRVDTIRGLLNHLSTQLRAHPRSRQDGEDSGGWLELGGVAVHRATVAKLHNRLNRVLEVTGDLLTSEQPAGNPLPVDQLRPGELWVVDITQLPDRARRFLFYRVMRELTDRLQRRKAGVPGLAEFPGRVVVMVDELNRLAPSGAGRHPTRSEIVGIATQGRSYGLTLLGLQQMASRIDEEVLTNTGTFVVGRAHPSELSGPAYGWLSRSLRDQVAAIPTGTMLVYHPLWKQPVFVRFPLPPHRLAERARKSSAVLGR